MSETTGGTPMFVCGPTTGCGKSTPMERIASGWITPRNCVHCGREWRRLPSQEITLTGDLLYAPAPRREDAPVRLNGIGKAIEDAVTPRREDAAGERDGHPTLSAEDRVLMHRAFLRVVKPWQYRGVNWSLEPEYVNAMFDAIAVPLLAALSTAERERDALHQQLGSSIDVARETMTEITTGRLASIGGIENTYCPQISVSRVKKLHERLVALADSYRARVPSGGKEGR